MKKNELVVLIPAYNEAEHIASVLMALNKSHYTYVLIDDGSSDNTVSIAKKFSKYILSHRVNLGKGAALKTGCAFAFTTLKAKAVVFMDSDGQHNPEELALFLDKLQSGSQVVLGIRSFDSTMPLLKIISNRFASICVYVLFGVYIPDIPSGYKALTKTAYQRLKWNSKDYRVELEIAVNLAKRNIAFSVVPIQTIYLDFTRGFQIVDALQMIVSLVSWRFTK